MQISSERSVLSSRLCTESFEIKQTVASVNPRITAITPHRHILRVLLVLGVALVTGVFFQISPALAQTPILIDFENLAPGTNVTEVTVDGLTVSVEATGGIGEAWIFDSSAPTGGDEDLGTPNQNCTPAGPGIGEGGVPGTAGENCVALGNILIIQENDNGIPDDAATGGTLTFTFSEPVIVRYFDLMDFEETTTPSITFYDENNQQLGTPISPTGLGDNSYERFDPEVDAGVFEVVTTILMDLPISGAIGGIEVVRASEVIDMGRIGDTITCVTTGEPLPNVLVTLTPQVGPSQTQNTDANGMYLFENLALGSYTVSVDPTTIAGTCNEPAVDPDDVLDNMSSVTLTVTSVTNLDQDFAYSVPATAPQLGSIGDTISCVTTGEPLPNVLVTLTSESAAPQTQNTDADGKYLFVDLPLGDYIVTVDPSTISGTCVEPAVDPDGVLDNTSTVTLTADAPNNLDQDFAYSEPATEPQLGTIGDTISCVTTGEPLPNVLVTLTSESAAPQTENTDADGKYLFVDLPLGDYIVTVDPSTIAGTCVEPAVDPDGVLDNTSTVTLTADVPNNLDQDFAYSVPAVEPQLGSIGDTISCATTGEPLPNVLVTLTNDSTAPQTQNTDADGKYLFADLPLGGYTVTVDPSTIAGTCVEPAVDPDGVLDNISTVTLTADVPNNLDQDFAYSEPATEPLLGSIGDTIFCDVNSNGAFDAGEGMAGIIVTLGGSATASTTTLAQGSYLFDNLEAGEYTVTIDPFSVPDSCNVASIDPDGGNDHLSTLTLGEGENNLDQDFGFVAPTQPALFPRLTLAKQVANTVVARGDSLVYSLIYANVGDVEAEGVQLNEGIPQGTTFDPVNSSPGWVCDGTTPGSSCVLGIGPVPANTEGDPVQFALIIDADLPEEITQISCVATLNSSSTDPTATSTASTTTEITPGAPDNLETVEESSGEVTIFLPLFQ